MMHGRVVIDSPQPPLNLGRGERSPILANGRLPGHPVKGYMTEYAEALQARYDQTHAALNRFYIGILAQSFGGVDLSGIAPVDRQALAHLARKEDPLT